MSNDARGRIHPVILSGGAGTRLWPLSREMAPKHLVDLIGSTPDVLASTARVIRELGWQPGQPWLEEVRVPADLPWEHSGTDVMHSRRQWAEWGVRRADGSPLEADDMQASLLLLMGRNGPAFLAYPNFINVYLEWNNSLVYATTAGYFATRLAGAEKVHAGRGEVVPLSLEEMKLLQATLAELGHDVGGVDGHGHHRGRLIVLERVEPLDAAVRPAGRARRSGFSIPV